MRKARENHGMTGHPLYRKWQDMRDRCYNPNSHRFQWYGGAGVTVCDEWRESALAFITWCLNKGWEPGKEIDKDIKCPGNKVYSPDTCSIVSHQENMIAVVGRASGRKSTKLKLTTSQVNEIIVRRDAGEKLRVLAEAYGVSHAAISRIHKLRR